MQVFTLETLEGTQEYICRLLLFLTAKPTNRMKGLGNEEFFRSQMSRQEVCFRSVQHQSLRFIPRVLNCLSWVVLGFTSNQFGVRFQSNLQNNVGLERLWRAQKPSDDSVLVWSCLCWSWCLFSFSAICLFSYIKSSDVKKKSIIWINKSLLTAFVL